MQFEKNKNLKPLSHYAIGGAADFFCAGENVDEIIEIIKTYGNKKIFILGGATNLLIDDAGVRGLVLKPSIVTLEAMPDCRLRVGAGVAMRDLVEAAIAYGFSGLEWAGGLPGTVGGAIRGNAGAFGGETKDTIAEVQSVTIDAKNPTIIVRQNNECAFGYRDSIFKKSNKEIIVEAVFQLKPGDVSAIKNAVAEKIQYRITRHPIELPNIGSIFKNVPVSEAPEAVQKQFAHVIKHDPFPVIPTACLLVEAGLKGASRGGAMVSPKHPNFIVNVDHASASDVKALIAFVKKTIKEKFDVILEEEVIYVE